MSSFTAGHLRRAASVTMTSWGNSGRVEMEADDDIPCGYDCSQTVGADGEVEKIEETDGIVDDVDVDVDVDVDEFQGRAVSRTCI